jgi:uncharacterized protein involved in outer membrane biogenesis
MERISGRSGLEAGRSTFQAHLEDGQLTAGLTSAGRAGGDIRIQAAVDAARPEPRIQLSTDVRDLDIATFMSQLEEDTDFAGLFSTRAELHATGERVADLATSLSGHAEMYQRDSTLASRYARIFVLDFMRAVLPGARPPEALSASCLAAELDIEQGVATARKLVMQTDSVEVSAEGTIDLGRRRLRLTLTPTVYDPGLLSTAATVRVTGPIADPRVRPVVRSLVTSAARGLVSNTRNRAGALLSPLKPLNPINAFRSGKDEVSGTRASACPGPGG